MQITLDSTLRHQIDAGAKGRRKDHSSENELAQKLNDIRMPYMGMLKNESVVQRGFSELILLNKVLSFLQWGKCDCLQAYATGKLATSEDGDSSVLIEGESITSAKSDIIIVLENSGIKKVVGVSIKQCNNRTPTNAQVFFTTATAFYNLLLNNGISLSENALIAMRQFCGDVGFRPIDDFDCSDRISSPERYFGEEINEDGRIEWESVFKNYQDEITRLLLQKGYSNDPFPPEIIMRKTKKIQFCG